MSDFDFEFDSSSAVQADRAANTLESAAYIGEFVAASLLESEGGAKALELVFRADEGGQATYSIWYKSGDKKGNKPVEGGVARINAIMGLFGLGSLKGQKGAVNRRIEGEQKEVEGVVYPALLGKKIGVINQNELVDGLKGGTFTQKELVMVFDPKTHLSYSEKANGDTTPKKVAKVLKGLKDKDSRKIKNTGMAGSIFDNPSVDDESIGL